MVFCVLVLHNPQCSSYSSPTYRFNKFSGSSYPNPDHFWYAFNTLKTPHNFETLSLSMTLQIPNFPDYCLERDFNFYTVGVFKTYLLMSIIFFHSLIVIMVTSWVNSWLWHWVSKSVVDVLICEEVIRWRYCLIDENKGLSYHVNLGFVPFLRKLWRWDYLRVSDSWVGLIDVSVMNWDPRSVW